VRGAAQAAGAMAVPSLRTEEIRSAPASAWLDPAAQEEHALIVHVNDAEREPLSRLHGAPRSHLAWAQQAHAALADAHARQDSRDSNE
jgi:hypothetical protein